MKRVLLTSFEPFGGHQLNSSQEVGRALAQAPPAGVCLDWLVLPVVAYGYTMEAFISWYSGNIYERSMMYGRMFGHFAPVYWSLVLCNIVIPQLLWFGAVRANLAALWAISVVVNVGMWLERYVIVVTSLHRDFLPSSWGMYAGTFWDWSVYLGSIGLFLTLFLLFVRFLPMISIFEVRTLLPEAEVPTHRAG